MWLKLEKFPVTLLSLTKGQGIGPTIISLRILSDGNITFFFKGENARLVIFVICNQSRTTKKIGIVLPYICQHLMYFRGK
jgi:hypothetical protein